MFLNIYIFFLAHEIPQKLFIIGPDPFLQYCQSAQIQLKSQFLLHKNLPPGNFSIMTLLESVNPQYDDKLFIELQVQYMKIPSSNLGRTCCVQKLFLTFRTFFVHNMFSPRSAKRRASDKDLPVQTLVLKYEVWI